MTYSNEVEQMCTVKKGPHHGPAPIPEEGKWVKSYQISDISGFSHGIGWCHCLNISLWIIQSIL